MEYLISKKCQFQKEIFKTYGCGGKYYCIENDRVVNMLNHFRKQKIIKTFK